MTERLMSIHCSAKNSFSIGLTAAFISDGESFDAAGCNKGQWRG
jgi:hypothetical protein